MTYIQSVKMSWEKLRNYYTHFRHKIVWNELYDKLPLSTSWMFKSDKNFDKILDKDPFQIIFLESHEKKDFILLMKDLTSDYMYRLKLVKDSITHPLPRIIYEYLFGESIKGEKKENTKFPERKSSDRICDIYLSKVLNIKLVMKNPASCNHKIYCYHEDINKWCEKHGEFHCDDCCEETRECFWEYSYQRSRCNCMGYKYVWDTAGIADDDWLCREKNEILGCLEIS